MSNIFVHPQNFPKVQSVVSFRFFRGKPAPTLKGQQSTLTFHKFSTVRLAKDSSRTSTIVWRFFSLSIDVRPANHSLYFLVARFLRLFDNFSFWRAKIIFGKFPVLLLSLLPVCRLHRWLSQILNEATLHGAFSAVSESEWRSGRKEGQLMKTQCQCSQVSSWNGSSPDLCELVRY